MHEKNVLGMQIKKEKMKMKKNFVEFWFEFVTVILWVTYIDIVYLVAGTHSYFSLSGGRHYPL